MPYNSIFQLLFNFIPRHHFEKAVNFPIAAVSFRGAALCEFLQLQEAYSALQYRTLAEAYFGTCNRQTVGYSSQRASTANFRELVVRHGGDVSNEAT